MKINDIFASKSSKMIAAGVGCLIVLLLVFHTGMMVGQHRAAFSERWGDNYHKNFAGPRDGFRGDFGGKKEFIDAHGVFGKVLKVDGDTLVISGKDGVEKIVVIGTGTEIMRFKEKMGKEELKTDDLIVVIGEPNDAGQIDAKLIRLMPPPPDRGRMGPPPGDHRRR